MLVENPFSFRSLTWWPRGVRARSTAAQLLGSWVRIPQGHGCSSLVFVMRYVGSGLWGQLITRSEEPYRVCEFMCGLETSTLRRPVSHLGCRVTENRRQINLHSYFVLKERFL